MRNSMQWFESAQLGVMEMVNYINDSVLSHSDLNQVPLGWKELFNAPVFETGVIKVSKILHNK